jgi:hypothetical protein
VTVVRQAAHEPYEPTPEDYRAQAHVDASLKADRASGVFLDRITRDYSAYLDGKLMGCGTTHAEAAQILQDARVRRKL